jgi:hypothetical protein
MEINEFIEQHDTLVRLNTSGIISNDEAGKLLLKTINSIRWGYGLPALTELPEGYKTFKK